jgi:uncharacterized membrane protein
LILIIMVFALGFLAFRLKPEIVMLILQAQGRDAAAFIADSTGRRLSYIGGLLTLMALLIPTLAFLLHSNHIPGKDADQNDLSSSRLTPSTFVLLLIALGALLILGPDFLYLRDQFGYRINTVFKFYYQAWILLSLASAYGTAVLLKNLRGAANGVFSVLFMFVLIVGLTYPVLGFLNKTSNFTPPFGYTLDDFDRVRRENPDEAAAILWLRAAPDGVVAEAVGGAYSSYARISVYTGLPTVIGWENHEGQWRDRALQGTRRQDVETLYSSPDWITTREIIRRYEIRYIYIGNLERATYRVIEEKFNRFLKPVFQQGNSVIYEVP